LPEVLEVQNGRRWSAAMRAASLCLAERSIANPIEGLRARIPNVGAQAGAWSPVCRVSGRPFGLQQAAQTMLGERAFAGAKQCYSRAPLLQRHTKTVSAASLRTPTHRLAHRLIQTSIHVTLWVRGRYYRSRAALAASTSASDPKGTLTYLIELA